jgi:hypothetical protein
VRDCRSRVTIQKAGHQGDSAHHVPGESHIETWCWGWFIKLHHPSIFHGSESLDGQGKLLEGAEENQVVSEIVWVSFVPPVLWLSSALWAQVAGAGAVRSNSLPSQHHGDPPQCSKGTGEQPAQYPAQEQHNSITTEYVLSMY